MAEENPQTKPLSFKDILFMPFGCLLSLPPVIVFVFLGIFGVVGYYLFYDVNIDLLGIGAPDFKAWNISSDFRNITTGDHYSWQIDFEFPIDSTFTGLVRHISPIRYSPIPMLTHDILVTSGDFANSAMVDTFVSDHHFTWVAKDNRNPSGKINLLHTVPYNQTIYQQLLSIQNDDNVTISGREIYQIRAYDPNNTFLVYWQDSGCNSILVKSVKINPK
jgi:hypothetical protein